MFRYINLLLAVTTAPTTSTVTDLSVMTPKEFEQACEQAVIIGTSVSSVTMVVVNVLGMFAMFTKMEKMFNPSRLAAKLRQQKVINRVTSRK